MERATREMTFDEEYEILLREAEELFSKETEGDETSFANCVVRRALRCINKLKDKDEEADANNLKKDEDLLYQKFRQNCLSQIKSVHELGEQIGYGAMMSWASALWRYSLVNEHGMRDSLGAFVPRIATELTDEEMMFDQWIGLYYSQKDKSDEIKSDAVSRSLIAIHISDEHDLTSLHHRLVESGYQWQGFSCIQGCHMIRQSTKSVYLTIDKKLKSVTCTSGKPRLDPYIYEMNELYDVDESLDSIFAFH